MVTQVYEIAQGRIQPWYVERSTLNLSHAPDGVVRIAWPRSDVKVTVDGMPLHPFAGLGSWAAFTATKHGAMVMGDTVVFQDEVTPEVVRKVYEQFRRATGQEPTMLFPGAGGYWWRLVHRDTVSAAFKRIKSMKLFPASRRRRSKHEVYREAWAAFMGQG
jgi:hypothetical protein